MAVECVYLEVLPRPLSRTVTHTEQQKGTPLTYMFNEKLRKVLVGFETFLQLTHKKTVGGNILSVTLIGQ